MKPCPFCGCAGRVSYMSGVFVVICNGCDAEGPSAGDPRAAAEYWDQRVA